MAKRVGGLARWILRNGAGVSSRIAAALLLSLSAPSALQAQAPAFLVADINDQAIIVDSNPGNFLTIGNTTFFAAFTTSLGRELWRTDGTEAGTVLVKDIVPGPGSGGAGFLVDFGGTLLFRADGHIWRSDGTEAGTVSVTTGFNPFDPRDLINVNGIVFFSAGVTFERELWRTDGTPAGTVQVKDIRPGPNGSDPQRFTAVNGTLFFTAEDGVSGDLDPELWKSNGTEIGTTLVRDIKPGIASSFPMPLGVLGNTLLFGADDGVAGLELWKTDGTDVGTVLVEDIRPGPDSSHPGGGSPTPATVVGGTLLFSANDGVSGNELWASDGTGLGTVLVKDIDPGPTSSSPFFHTALGPTLFFAADDGAAGNELWLSDGTEFGTVIVKDINPGAGSSFPGHFTAAVGKLFFRVFTPTTGAELWVSDGTEAGTSPLVDACPGTCSGFPFSFPTPVVELNGAVLFRASDGVAGQELWRTDGTGAGTALLKNIASDDATADSSPAELVDLGGTLYFTADDGVQGTELWRSDGSETGTTLVKDINPGGAGAFSYTSGPVSAYFTEMSGALFFAADDGMTGLELWRTDGTEIGTVLVKDIVLGPTGGLSLFTDPPLVLPWPPSFTAANGTLFFAADDRENGQKNIELWSSDGTEVGTLRVKDLTFNVGGSFPSQLVDFNGLLMFQAYSSPLGFVLWRSDGSDAGTQVVEAITPDLMTVMGSTLFFRGGQFSKALWRSDGTEPGTMPVVASGLDLGFATSISEIDQTLYFGATDGVTGVELWKSDGTAPGTTLAKNIAPGASSSFPDEITNIGGRFLFSAQDTTSGIELYVSDGTDSGTTQVLDIYPGPDSSYPYLLRRVGNSAVFTACEPLAGCEVWASGGTAASTRLVADIVPGPEGSNPGPYVVSGAFVYFPATVGGDTGTGRELWAIPIASLAQCGDGALDFGEACDDGNTQSGDCCSGDCQTPAPAGNPCDDAAACTENDACDANGTCSGIPNDALCNDGNLCTDDTCTASGCANVGRPPAASCRNAARALLVLRHDPATEDRDRLSWRWLKGESVMMSELGDPTATTDYALCVHAAGAFAFGVPIASDAAKWAAVSESGFRYHEATGVRGALVKSSDSGRSRAWIKGKGPALPDPPLPFAPPVTVQLINSTTNLCVETVFDSAAIATNDGVAFRAQGP